MYNLSPPGKLNLVNYRVFRKAQKISSKHIILTHFLKVKFTIQNRKEYVCVLDVSGSIKRVRKKVENEMKNTNVLLPNIRKTKVLKWIEFMFWFFFCCIFCNSLAFWHPLHCWPRWSSFLFRIKYRNRRLWIMWL